MYSLYKDDKKYGYIKFQFLRFFPFIHIIIWEFFFLIYLKLILKTKDTFFRGTLQEKVESFVSNSNT